MSKKESEFDRYDRMKRLQREAEVQKKKNDYEHKKGGKPKSVSNTSVKDWARDYELDFGNEHYDEIN